MDTFELFLLIFIPVLAFGLTALAIYLKKKLPPTKLEKGKELAQIAIKALLGLAKTQGWDESYLTLRLIKLTEKIGLKLTEDQIKRLIEATSKELEEFWKKI